MLVNIIKKNIFGENSEKYGIRRYSQWYVSSGHNMSQADATSLEGEAPATTGCYKQYEHSITNKLPQSTDPNQVIQLLSNVLGTSNNHLGYRRVSSKKALCSYLFSQ